MNKKYHIWNGVGVGVGVTVVLVGVSDWRAVAVAIPGVTLPVVLGALLPDIDTEFGRHRKTGHNLFVLAALVAFPAVYGNLRFVWLGVIGHFAVDLLLSKRGLALFYPLSKREYRTPGSVDHGPVGVVALAAVTALVVGAFALVVYTAAAL